jgi:serine protease AprX
VITVGAVDLSGTTATSDDTVAPWSAYGYTNDGFYKPEIVAPGRYVVGPVPSTSTIALERPDKMVGTNRIQLSGTSFAAPVIAGAAAQILALRPTWGPDQVKGVLMKTARKVAPAYAAAAGLGEVTIPRAMIADSAPNPNIGLNAFVVPDATASGRIFDAQSWAAIAQASLSWNSMSWSSQSWSDLSWSDQSWSSLSWSDLSWSSMSWSDQSWSDQSWSDSAQEDAVEGDTTADPSAFTLDPVDETLAAQDDDLNVPIVTDAP